MKTPINRFKMNRLINYQIFNYRTCTCQLTIQHTSLFSSMIIFSPEDIVNLGKLSWYLSGLSASWYTRRMSGLTKKSSSAESFSFRFIALHRSAKSSSTSITSPTTRLVSGFMEEKYFKVAESIVMISDYDCLHFKWEIKIWQTQRGKIPEMKYLNSSYRRCSISKC